MYMIKRAFLLVVLFSLTACGITPVATKDPQIEFLLVQNKVTVNAHWVRLLELEPKARTYTQFDTAYLTTTDNLQMLLELNKMRMHNQDSVKQSENLVSLWHQDMKEHQKNNSMSDFVIKRRVKQYKRAFDAMILAESVKLGAQER